MVSIHDYRGQIERALAYSGGTHLFEDVVEGVAAGRMQMWPNGDSVAVTEIIEYPRKKVLHVFLAAGRMSDLTDMIDAAFEWGKAYGCTAMTMAGRHGWRRVLARHGWQPVLSVMEKTA
jgi:hypothetical protein